MQPGEPDGPYERPGELDESPERAGPVPLPDDTWDTAPTRTHDHVRSHRLPERPRALALIVAGALVAVVAVVLIVVAGRSPSDPTAGGGPSRTTGARQTATTPDPTTPAASPSVTATEVPAVDDAPPFAPLVYEAEAGMATVRLRHANVVQLDGASGGAAVQFTRQMGSIEIRSVDVPTTDAYRVTINYASDGGWSVGVHGSNDSQSVQLGPSGCCGSASVAVRLSPGGSLIIEPSQGDGPFPAVDRIVIERA